MTPPDRSAPPSNQIRAVRIQAKCPVCGKPADAKYQPFCTKRCADIDLGRWLKEGYRVPTDEGPGEEDTPASPPTGQGPTGQQR
jgi:endogenous inhibitor of DNA gyrase (YacG/DUF329 family)